MFSIQPNRNVIYPHHAFGVPSAPNTVRFGTNPLLEQADLLKAYVDLSRKSVPQLPQQAKLTDQELIKKVSDYGLACLSPSDLDRALAMRKSVEFPEVDVFAATQNMPIHTLPVPLPTSKDIYPMKTGEKIDYMMPVLPGHKLTIKQNDVSPYLDWSPDSDARKMVSGGIQPYEMATSYDARWSAEKTCRDILQNFFDSHGKTLEGVRIVVEALPDHKQSAWHRNTWLGKGIENDEKEDLIKQNKKYVRLFQKRKAEFDLLKNWMKNPVRYKVRVEGKGQYNYEKAYYMGDGGKTHDPTAAGGYGEGLKITALNLLRDFGAESVTMSSGDWSLAYSLEQHKKRLKYGAQLMYELKHLTDPQTRPEGSSLEFVTDDPRMVIKLFEAIQYFQHPYNPDFQAPLFHNAVGGIKLWGPKQSGHPYIAGQRYEAFGKYTWENSLPGTSVWLNNKSPDTQVDRDRSPLTQEDFRVVYKTLMGSLSIAEKLELLKKLQPLWKDRKLNRSQGASQQLLDILAYELMGTHKVTVKFPPQYIANDLSSISADLNESQKVVKQRLKKAGYVVCKPLFLQLGMKRASDVIQAEIPSLLKSKTQAEEILPNNVTATDGSPITFRERIRFHAIGEIFSQLKGAFCQLHAFCGLDTFPLAYDEKGTFARDNLVVNRNTLNYASPDRALSQMLFSFLRKYYSEYSADYSYRLTDLTEWQFKLKDNGRTLAALDRFRKLWKLSFQPTVTIEKVTALLKEFNTRHQKALQTSDCKSDGDNDTLFRKRLV